MNRALIFTLFFVSFVLISCSDTASTEDNTKVSSEDIPEEEVVSDEAQIVASVSAEEVPYTIRDSSNVMELEGGIKLFIIEKGSGPIPKEGSNVIIDYHGTLLDGSEFDSSFDTEGYQDFRLGDLIRGWQIGLTAVPSGSKIKLVVPPEMGYGSQDRTGIPANSTLIFDIHLVSTY